MEHIDIPLAPGWTYGLHMDPKDLGSLATGILQHLGCSFEINWPEGDLGAQTAEEKDRDRKRALQNLNDNAEQYASAHTPFTEEVPREIVQEHLQDAYKAGFLNAPKSLHYPVQSRGRWTP